MTELEITRIAFVLAAFVAVIALWVAFEFYKEVQRLTRNLGERRSEIAHLNRRLNEVQEVTKKAGLSMLRG